MNVEKAMNRPIVLVVWLAATVFSSILIISAIAVAWHFVSKFW